MDLERETGKSESAHRRKTLFSALKGIALASIAVVALSAQTCQTTYSGRGYHPNHRIEGPYFPPRQHQRPPYHHYYPRWPSRPNYRH